MKIKVYVQICGLGTTYKCFCKGVGGHNHQPMGANNSDKIGLPNKLLWLSKIHGAIISNLKVCFKKRKEESEIKSHKRQIL